MPRKFIRVNKAKRMKKSSHKWLLRQINDPFVEQARAEGWRCRAAFKIIEIDEKFKLFKKGKVVVDLGAAPGGWSQYVVTKVGEGRVVAIDLCPASATNTRTPTPLSANLVINVLRPLCDVAPVMRASL